MKADPDLIGSININSNEVKDTKFVPISHLHTQTNLTPWMQKISESGLLSEWIKDFKDNDHSDCEFIKTKYSHDSIIKL